MKNIIILTLLVSNAVFIYFWQKEKAAKNETYTCMKDFLPVVEAANNAIVGKIENFTVKYKNDVLKGVSEDISTLSNFMHGYQKALNPPNFTFFQKDVSVKNDSIFHYNYQKYVESVDDSARLIRKNIFCSHILKILGNKSYGGYCGFYPKEIFVTASTPSHILKLHQGDTIHWNLKMSGHEFAYENTELVNQKDVKKGIGQKGNYSFIVPKYNKNGNNRYKIDKLSAKNALTNQIFYVDLYFLLSGEYDVIE